MASLPLIASTPCATCHGPCCQGRVVMASAFDLCRLSDAFGVPWPELALVGVAFSAGFRLDSGPTRWGFRLRQRPTGSCVLALGGGEKVRCAAHASRPSACRVYPLYVGLGEGRPSVGLGNNAVCPPDEAAAWSRVAAPELVEAEVAEHTRYLALIERWEASLDRPREADEFVRFARESL